MQAARPVGSSKAGKTDGATSGVSLAWDWSSSCSAERCVRKDAAGGGLDPALVEQFCAIPPALIAVIGSEAVAPPATRPEVLELLHT